MWRFSGDDVSSALNINDGVRKILEIGGVVLILLLLACIFITQIVQCYRLGIMQSSFQDMVPPSANCAYLLPSVIVNNTTQQPNAAGNALLGSDEVDPGGGGGGGGELYEGRRRVAAGSAFN